MSGTRWIRLASGATAVGCCVATLLALATLAAGGARMAGWTDRDSWSVPVPVVGQVRLVAQPSWDLVGYGEVCRTVDLREPGADPSCLAMTMTRQQSTLDDRYVVTSDVVRPVQADLSGRLLLSADPGWNALLAGLYAMAALGWALAALVLLLVWRILRSAAAEEPFTLGTVRRIRQVAGVLLGWQVVQPVLWLFLSPKAHEYALTTYLQSPQLQLGSMEPGALRLSWIAFGLLLLVLAQVFRQGVVLADEQRMTV